MRHKYQHTLEKINTNLKWKQSSFEVGGQSLDLLSLHAMKYGVSKIICPNLSSELQTLFIIVQGNNISQLPSKHIIDKYLLRLIWSGRVLNRREMWSREGPTSWKSAIEILAFTQAWTLMSGLHRHSNHFSHKASIDIFLVHFDYKILVLSDNRNKYIGNTSILINVLWTCIYISDSNLLNLAYCCYKYGTPCED